jgi:mono/diheme cytochrome c family protein
VTASRSLWGTALAIAFMETFIALAARGATRPSAAPSEPGAGLFASHCGICHFEMGPGTLTLAARLGRKRALLSERPDLEAGYVRYVVRNGVGSMPPQTRVDLSDAELDLIAAYLARPASKRPPGGPGRHG